MRPEVVQQRPLMMNTIHAEADQSMKLAEDNFETPVQPNVPISHRSQNVRSERKRSASCSNDNKDSLNSTISKGSKQSASKKVD